MKTIKNETFTEKQITGEIKDKKYVDCTFSDLVFDGAVVTNCQFENCSVLDCVGNKSKIQNNTFSGTVIKDIGIVKGKIEKNNFDSTKVLSTAVLSGEVKNNNFKKCEFEYNNFSWTNFNKNIYEDSHAAGIADKASNFEEEFPAENLEACGGWPIQCKSCNLAAYDVMLRHFDKQWPELDAQLTKPKRVKTEIVKDKDFSKRLLAKDLSNKTFINCKFVLSNTIKSDIENSNFLNCDISGANLSKANINNCTFEDVNFSCANLFKSNIKQTKFMNCNFIQTNLSNLTFNNCQVKKSVFNLASYSRSTIYHSKFNNSEFGNTRMTYLKFSQNYMDNKTLASFLVGPEDSKTQRARQELRTKMDSLVKTEDYVRASTCSQMAKA